MIGHYIDELETKRGGTDFSEGDIKYTELVNSSKTVAELRAQNEEIRKQNEEMRKQNQEMRDYNTKQLQEMHNNNMRSFCVSLIVALASLASAVAAIITVCR